MNSSEKNKWYRILPLAGKKIHWWKWARKNGLKVILMGEHHWIQTVDREWCQEQFKLGEVCEGIEEKYQAAVEYWRGQFRKD